MRFPVRRPERLRNLQKKSGCCGLPQRDARCDEKAARFADYDEPGSTGFLDAFDKAIRRADELI